MLLGNIALYVCVGTTRCAKIAHSLFILMYVFVGCSCCGVYIVYMSVFALVMFYFDVKEQLAGDPSVSMCRKMMWKLDFHKNIHIYTLQ